MGFLRILGDSARILGVSRGFSGFLQELYDVSGVSNPSGQNMISEPSVFIWLDQMLAH